MIILNGWRKAGQEEILVAVNWVPVDKNADNFFIITGNTHQEVRGKETPWTEGGGGEAGHWSGGGQVPGPEKEGGHRESQDPAVLPDRPRQKLPRKQVIVNIYNLVIKIIESSQSLSIKLTK